MVITRFWERIRLQCACHNDELLPNETSPFPLICPKKYKKECNFELDFESYQWLLETLGNLVAVNEVQGVVMDFTNMVLEHDNIIFTIIGVKDGVFMITVKRRLKDEAK